LIRVSVSRRHGAPLSSLAVLVLAIVFATTSTPPPAAAQHSSRGAPRAPAAHRGSVADPPAQDAVNPLRRKAPPRPTGHGDLPARRGVPRAASRSARPAAGAFASESAAATAPAGPPGAEEPAEHVYFAGLENLRLRLPHGVQVVGFHESGDRRAIHLHPVGRPRHNDNLPRLPSAPVSGDGGEYVVMHTRGRGTPPTSAVDLSLPHGIPVESPVGGTVTAAESYALYRRIPDELVVVAPDQRPDLRVVTFHLEGVRVEVGQRVEAGNVIADSARQLPVNSQVDKYVGGRGPHLHVEVRLGD
jgi:murein DD-endopeptidase MepM/ murein hydrolase activator NlpD